MKILLATLAVLCSSLVQASTPSDLLVGYQSEAGRRSVGFQASSQRGARFFRQRFGQSARMPACASCHTDSPVQAGRHVVTDKAIKPLATAANAERFTDPAKVEKWFRRNCTEVVGRECSAAEKADFIAFVMEGR
jgi:cytochrome c553